MNPAVPTIAAPRVGGTDDTGAWTGKGSGGGPKSGNCYRQFKTSTINDHKARAPIEAVCRAGLKPPRIFCQSDESEAKMTIPTIVALQAYAIEHGLESVFCIVQDDGTEINMLETPGLVNLDMVKTWVTDLTVDGVHDGNGGRHAVCPYDRMNLTWSGAAVLNSCSDQFCNELVSQTIRMVPECLLF